MSCNVSAALYGAKSFSTQFLPPFPPGADLLPPICSRSLIGHPQKKGLIMGIAIFTRKQVEELVQFCKKHNKTQFFLAKDQGLYIGQTVGSQKNNDFENNIQYANGCDPKLDDDEWWDNSRDIAGGDDFGEHLPLGTIEKTLADNSWKNLKVKITETELTFIV